MAQQYRRNPERPLGPDRYQLFADFMAELATSTPLLKLLQRAFENTQDPYVRAAVELIQEKRRLAELEFWSVEDAYRAEELAELWHNFGLWPASIRDWMIHYWEKDL